MGHGGQRSGSISAVVLWAAGDATWSSDHGDPAHYSLQTICFFTFLHSSTCRSWKKVICCFNTSLTTEGFKQLVFERSVASVGRKKEGRDTQHHLCNVSAAMLTPVSERLGAASHLRTLFYWPWMRLTTKHQQHPHNYSILITVKILHLILKLPSAKINWP